MVQKTAKNYDVQWRTHGGWGGGFGGQNPPIEDFKRNENFPFGNEPMFFIQRQPKLLLCFSVLSSLLVNLEKLSLWCNNRSAVKLFWCAALDDCRKSEIFLFWNEPTFLRAELAATAVLFFRSVQLSNLISRNFYYHAMQQYRYFNFSDVFCLNYNFVIDAAAKQLVSRSFLKYDSSAVTMAAHKI